MNTRLMIERTKANKAGDCTVYIEVSSSGNNQKKRTVRIPTAIKVHVDNWSVKGQAVVRGKSKDYYKINQMLIGQKQLVMEIIADLSQKGAFQLSDIKKIYKEKTSPIILGFFEIYDEFLMRRDVSMTRNGVKDYKTLRSHLVSFESYRKQRIILREVRSEEHTYELQSRPHLVCRLLLEKKKKKKKRKKENKKKKKRVKVNKSYSYKIKYTRESKYNGKMSVGDNVS